MSGLKQFEKGLSGIVISACASSAGKTTVTLAILRAFKNSGVRVRGAKGGPDYIDPQFHEVACGCSSVNLDAWAMNDTMLRSMAMHEFCGEETEFLIVEGAMGVLDGAGMSGEGSTAALSESLGLPVVLVLDASKQARSAVLGSLGLKVARPDLNLAGVILNNVGSPRHESILRNSFRSEGIPVVGSVPCDANLGLPDRHLGLVPVGEHEAAERWMEYAASIAERHVDLDALRSIASPISCETNDPIPVGIDPLGQKIAVARDDAFAFAYPHLLSHWRRAGAEMEFFSPLADQPPPADADAVFLPGGYPELHAGAISAAAQFRDGMRRSARRNARIYGECGGYMVLGKELQDKDGERHEMLGFLMHRTTFKSRRLHLGYRVLKAKPGAPFSGAYSGHEFHYSQLQEPERGNPLFAACDADGNALPDSGGIDRNVSGSFAHLICVRPA